MGKGLVDSRLVGFDALLGLHSNLNWMLHAVLAIAFFGLATAYFFRHLVVSALSVALRPYKPPEEVFPTGAVGDLTWKDLLDADACTTCGRCTSVCPATTAGKALDPRAVVLKLSHLISRHAASNGDRPPSAFDTITDSELWDCTTCGACNAECPVDIEVFDKIIDLRRQLVEIGRLSPAASSCLEGLDRRQNPWGYAPSERGTWCRSVDQLATALEGKLPQLYNVGDSYSPRSLHHAIVEAHKYAREI